MAMHDAGFNTGWKNENADKGLEHLKQGRALLYTSNLGVHC